MNISWKGRPMKSRHAKSVALVTTLILWCISQPAAGQGPVKHAAPQAGTAAAAKVLSSSLLNATMMKLRQIRVKELDTDIPEAAKPLLTTVKQELCGLIHDTLNDPGFRGMNPQELRAQIVSRLKSIGIAVAEPQPTSDTEPATNTFPPFGSLLRVTLATPDGYPDLLAATTTLSIPCGDDSSLYLFEKHSDGWKLILGQEVNDYDSISDAQGSLGYAVGPSDRSQPFFVVMASVNPWCTSNWQGIRYTVMRPGKTAYQPVILYSTTDTIYLGNAEDYRITVTSNGFTMEFESSAPDNSDELSAKKRIKYQVSGNRVGEYR
jgi:hypothetical protein